MRTPRRPVRPSWGNLRSLAAILTLAAYYEVCKLTAARTRLDRAEHERMIRRLTGGCG